MSKSEHIVAARRGAEFGGDKGKPKPASEIAATDTLFNQALKETLHLITDNIYPVYLKKEAEGKGGSPAPAPAPAPKGGGCCAVL